MILVVHDKELSPAEKRSCLGVLYDNNYQAVKFKDGDDVGQLIYDTKPDAVILIGIAVLQALFPRVSAVHEGGAGINLDGSSFTYKSGLRWVRCLFANLGESFAENMPCHVSKFNHDYADIPFPREITPKIKFAKNVGELKEFFEKLDACEEFAFDVETGSLDPKDKRGGLNTFGEHARLFSIAIAFPDGHSVGIPLKPGYWPEAVEKRLHERLSEALFTSGKKVIAHNLKFDLKWTAWHFGYTGDFHENYEDTKLMAALIHFGRAQTGLKLLAPKYLGVSDWSVDVKDLFSSALFPEAVDKVLEYNCLDSFYTMELYKIFSEAIENVGDLKKAYREAVMPGCLAFAKMELQGVPVSRERLASRKAELEADVANARAEIAKHTTADFNPNSAPQLAEYFIGKGYKLSGKTPTGKYKVDVDTLNKLAEKEADPVAIAALKLRTASKLLKTYIGGIEDNTTKRDDMLRADFKMASVVSGRTSCSNPNLQNFPKGDTRIRQIMQAPAGYKVVSFDYGQIEARVIGILSGDKVFCDAILTGYDIHLENAKMVFGEDKAKSKRGIAKQGTFALLYGGGDRIIAHNLGVPMKDIAKLRKVVFERFRAFKPYMDSVCAFADKSNYAESIYGRRRYMPMSQNECLNHPSQSSASDITLHAMSVLNKEFRILLNVHDDLTMLLPEEGLEESIQRIMGVMSLVPYRIIKASPWVKAWVPLQVECAVGDSWGEQEEHSVKDSRDFGGTDYETCVAAYDKLMGRV